MKRAPSLHSIIRNAVALQVLAALVVGTMSIAVWLVYRDQAMAGDRARDALIAAERLRGDVLSGESGVRGYALTGDIAFLGPYRASLGSVTRGERRLRALLDAEEELPLDAALREVSIWRSVFARPLLDHVQARDLDGARRLARTGIGKRHIDAFRNHAARLAQVVDARAQDRERIRDRIAVVGGLAIVLATALGVMAALLLRRRLTRDAVSPVQELARTADSIAAGDLGARVGVAGSLELEAAGSAFNEMARELEAVVSGLRDLDALRVRYVGSAAHELRNPLAGVIGHLDEMRDGDLGDLTEDQCEALDVALRNARRLDRMIDDLLLLSRLESGHLELDRVALELDGLVGDVLTDLRPVAEAAGVSLSLSAPIGVRVDADTERIRQCVANLVSNAVKFSSPGATVDVTVRDDAGSACVTVADRGVGIPAAELHRVGERFFRASTSKGVKGTGLGLAITRELLELHGGGLEARAREGGGTEFRATLPGAGQPTGVESR